MTIVISNDEASICQHTLTICSETYPITRHTLESPNIIIMNTLKIFKEITLCGKCYDCLALTRNCFSFQRNIVTLIMWAGAQPSVHQRQQLSPQQWSLLTPVQPQVRRHRQQPIVGVHASDSLPITPWCLGIDNIDNMCLYFVYSYHPLKLADCRHHLFQRKRRDSIAQAHGVH